MPVLTAEDTAPEFAVLGHTSKPQTPLPKPRGVHRWTVLAVKSRQERALVGDLFDRRITYFLPMAHDEASTGRSTVQTMRPLFPGYAFVYCDAVTLYTRVLAGEPRKRIFDHVEPPMGAQAKLYDELSLLRAVKGAYVPLPDVAGYTIGRPCEFLAPEALKGLRTSICGVNFKAGGTQAVIQVPVAMLGASVFEVPYQNLRLL